MARCRPDSPARPPSSTRAPRPRSSATSRLPRRPRAAREHRLRLVHARRRRRGRPLDRRRSASARARRSRSGPTRRPRWRHGRRHVRRTRAPAAAGPPDRPHGHGVRPGHRGRAAVRDRRDGHRPRPGRDRHEVGPARRAVRAPGARAAEPAPAPVRAADLRRQPGRGDRLADVDAAHPASSPRESDVCLVLECARANGDIVSSRKGILDARVTVHGRAAHAGVEPEKGRSAILAAADLVTAAPRPERPLGRRDGQRRGDRRRHPAERRRRALLARGRRPRRPTRADLEAAEAEIRVDAAARPVVPDVTAELEPMARWWPMEKLERSGRLVDHAQAIAERLGFERPRRRDRRGVRRQHDVRHGRADDRRPRPDRRASTTRRRSTSRSPRSCRGRRSSRVCCSRSPRDPEVRRRGGPRRRRRWRERRPPISSGGPWEAPARLQPGGRHRRFVLGRRARPTRVRTARRPIPATRRARPGPRSGSSSAALGRPVSDARRCRPDPDVHRSVEDAPAVAAVHGELFGDDPARVDARPRRRPDRPVDAGRGRARGAPRRSPLTAPSGAPADRTVRPGNGRVPP